MLVELKIRLTKPMLGDSNTGSDYLRKFTRDKDDQFLKTPIREWAWTLREAMEILRMDQTLDVSLVQFPTRFRKPTLVPYAHGYGGKEDIFESINPGTVLTFIFFLPKTAPNGRFRPPTFEELIQLLEVVGTHVGWTPWGRKWGFGRFKFESIRETDQKTAAFFV